jgi:cysteine desulfurase family protein (TIGR01976 family)
MSLVPVSNIRADFPALDRRHRGQPVAYFDGPGGTQVPRAVTRAMAEYLHHHNANTHWGYPTSAETDAALAQARTTFGHFLGADPDEVVFGANMTTLTLHASRALARSFPTGAELVVTELDHHANVDPWRELAKDYDVTVRTARMIPETGQLDWDDLERLVTRRTALVAIGAASNALGTISDVRRAADLAHAVGALVYVDGVHYAPHLLPDVHALGADFFACSPYKFYGPHLGVLWGRGALLDRLDAPRLLPAGQTAPERFETGTLNHEGIVGAAAAVEWLASLGDAGGSERERLMRMFAELSEREDALARRMWQRLEAIDGITLYGPPPGTPRTAMVVFTVAGRRAGEVTRLLADRAVFTSHGDFYAQTVIERLGLAPDGIVRAGCACYTTGDEVDRLITGVREIVSCP